MRTDEQTKAVSDLMDMFSPEPLHPDLLKYRFIGSIGPMIHHPLIISVMHADSMNKMVNRRYEHVKGVVFRAKIERAWETYVFAHERPYRLDAFREIAKEFGFSDGTKYWNLVGNIWTDSENVYENFDRWIAIWSSTLPNRHAMMDEEETAQFSALENSITIWRGASHPDVADGMSWTLNEDKAKWFAGRFSKKHKNYLAKGVVDKADVLAYLNGRNEQEIVVLPKNVKNIRITKISKK